ncbi:flagellar motor chemotaxis protein MotA [Gluconobacter thailandicus F149-1 = NBRC 100600]|uniref:Flagellar motor protein MotA n=1 Tax=Gluconobacter thailandicus NBRC 3257 TaxID=1381097 RepID=A0ABQ0ISG9_GLUTH|nr:flagellar motor stator protein MotA [Gluconobacter thailandicus]KXV53334.1 flagellar motor protein MotA [Gluconobacter thailandicus]GAC88390.1 flagellar motor protein MotA [Gluconobacter thailandicus NBRC 3255]GAD25164.1 flagellar motor protein MotA [Gluconobacter thailandicus NBRC 3257]GAN94421.1 flagellar motor chemotaxis protein MotA [Gluconobacter thailandicus F149-1 = NBRC 100600]GBR59083.1 flagellar motor protein MotA [Gluconobacter thailandicus F149-1 = NBRC 100600]
MFILIGLGVVLACVFGSFVASGGAIGPLLASMPFELLTILGAAVGTFVMANSIGAVKHLPAGIKKAMKGSQYTRQDYLELLGLLFHVTKLAAAKGMMAIESHIEDPQGSTVFGAFPKIRDNEHVCSFICDYLRMAGMNATDPFQMDDVMGRELKKNLREEMHLPHALQSVSDALPALGIVAAVLGVIKTMASISKPPIVLGEMIAGALVGTFLGILLAYGIVAPIAGRLGGVVEEEASYLDLVRSVIVAHLQGNAPQVSVEIGRKSIPSDLMPTFQEVEESLSAVAVN